MEDEDLKLQLKRNKDFIATQEYRGSKIFLTLENAKKDYHEIHKLQKGPIITLTDPAQQTTVIHQHITSDVHEINDILVDTFQNIYNKQDDLKSSEKDIIDFLNCDNDLMRNLNDDETKCLKSYLRIWKVSSRTTNCITRSLST